MEIFFAMALAFAVLVVLLALALPLLVLLLFVWGVKNLASLGLAGIGKLASFIGILGFMLVCTVAVGTLERDQSIHFESEAEFLSLPWAKFGGDDRDEDEIEAEAEDAEEVELASDENVSVDRPTWIGTRPKLEHGIYSISLVSDPKLTKKECDQALEPELEKVAAEYIDEFLGTPGAAAAMGLTGSEIRQSYCTDEWVEPWTSSMPEMPKMQRVHVKLEFTPLARQGLGRRWNEVQRSGRAEKVGAMALGLLGCLGVALLVLKSPRKCRAA